jgi:two-component system sensor histidine kinase YesM
MREVKQGNIDVGISVKGDDEISDMAHVFTDMTARIKKLIEEIKLEQQLVTETEIKAMQNQINAHFLYNVLETIKMQAELHDEDTIVHSITLLGKMLRYCLRLKQHRVSLREEMEYIRSYIALLNIRNDYSITLNEYISDRCMDYIIPKMLIQPLIENAFLYAIEPLGNNAAIDIRVYADDGDKILWIEVNDYGDGLNPDELEIVRINIDQERTEDIPGGIGLRNIQQRLTVFYGDAWRLHITSIPGKGTTIHIPIPMDAAACQLF